MGKPTVLMFGMAGETGRAWRMTAMRLGIFIRMIDGAREEQSLSELLGAQDTRESDAGAMDWEEPMMVMAHFRPGMLDAFLTGARRLGAPRIELKAVLTQSNAGWTARRLFEELRAERAAFRQGTSEHEPKER